METGQSLLAGSYMVLALKPSLVEWKPAPDKLVSIPVEPALKPSLVEWKLPIAGVLVFPPRRP